MASHDAAQRACWLNIALGAAAASGRVGVISSSCGGWPSRRLMTACSRSSVAASSDDTAEVMEEYEEVLSAFAQATQNPLKLIGALHLLRSHGRDDLAKASQ